MRCCLVDILINITSWDFCYWKKSKCKCQNVKQYVWVLGVIRDSLQWLSKSGTVSLVHPAYMSFTFDQLVFPLLSYSVYQPQPGLRISSDRDVHLELAGFFFLCYMEPEAVMIWLFFICKPEHRVVASKSGVCAVAVPESLIHGPQMRTLGYTINFPLRCCHPAEACLPTFTLCLSCPRKISFLTQVSPVICRTVVDGLW